MANSYRDLPAVREVKDPGIRRPRPHVRRENRGGAPAAPSRTDHPHVRGEHFLTTLTWPVAGGSSPRAWGNPGVLRAEQPRDRIIPTCVGKTISKERNPGTRTDHPHVRGENNIVNRWLTQFIGSSPRAWGKLDRMLKLMGEDRIIPTCVGKTSRGRAAPRRRPDHPHVRGENSAEAARAISQHGSSPRAWGKLGRSCEGFRSRRIIPTCVGKTSARARPSPRLPDHPHVRGENVRPRDRVHIDDGSSPRAWGKRCRL